MQTKITAAVSVSVLALLLSSCASQPPASEQSPAAVEDHGAIPVDGAKVSPVEAGSQLTGTNIAELNDPNSILSKRSVFFDFDQFVVKDEFRPLLQAHGRLLGANAPLKTLIQGNTDERGSREYNLALGQKRAEAVKKSLLLLGAREDQVEAVSLGEEKPRCTEQTEICWSENRRADMLYTGEF